MNWLQSSALKSLKHRRLAGPQFLWFEVNQDLRVPRGKIVKTRLMDQLSEPPLLMDGWNLMQHHKNALAPNVVHAADAALITRHLPTGINP